MRAMSALLLAGALGWHATSARADDAGVEPLPVEDDVDAGLAGATSLADGGVDVDADDVSALPARSDTDVDGGVPIESDVARDRSLVDAGVDEPRGEDGLTAAERAALAAALGEDAAARAEGAPSAADATANPGAIAQSAMRMLQSMNPDMSLILDVAGALFSTQTNLQTGAHDPRQMGFNLQQLELHVSSAVDPFFRFEANVVFSLFGVEIEEACATTLSLPFALQARVGQFLTRFGRLNATHPHTWNFADQPLVLGKFMGSEGNRGLGGELSWLAPLPWYLEILGSVTSAGGECCARSFFGGEDLGVRSPLDVVGTAAVKQFFPFGDDLSALVGLSAQSGPNPSGRWTRTELYGGDLTLRYRPVASSNRTAVWFQGEGIVRRRQVPGTVLSDAGFYAQVVGQFLLQWELALRVEGVTGLVNDPLDPDWTGLRTRTSAQLTYYPSHFSRVRLQGAYGTPGAYEDPLPSTLLADPVWSCFVALEFLVGAHGAHTF